MRRSPARSPQTPRPRKQLRGDLDAILNKALKKNPAERYATIDALAQDLGRHMRGEPVLARPDRPGYRLRKFVLRNRLAAGATAAVLVAIVSGTGLALWQASVARARSDEASAQAALAKKEAQRAQAAQGFMLDLFRTNTHQQADPLKAQQTTARQLLDIGAERVSVALKDAPESEITVLNTLSDMYVQLGLRDKAIALQRRSVDVARRVHGPADPGRADAILGYVATLQERPERSEIPPLLDETRAALDAAGETTTFLRGALLMETARYAKLEGYPGARDTADAAVAFFRQHQPQRASLITTYRLAGQARLQARDFDGAEAAFHAAVETARLRGNAAPAWLVGSLADLGEAQQGLLEFARAEASLREALAHSTKVNGDAHGETLLTRLKVANLLLATGRTAEGLALRAGVQATLAREPARYDASWRVTADDLLGTHATARGRPQDAAAQIEADVAGLQVMFPRSSLLAARELALAECWLALGRHPDARRMLDRAVAHRRVVLGGAGDLRAWLPYLRVQARLARAEGHPDQALATLAAVPTDTLATRDGEAIAIEIERAHALRLTGRSEDAAAAAHRALLRLQSVPAPYSLPALEAAAWVAAGETALAQGQRGAAREAFVRALAIRRAHDAEGSLGIAEVEGALAALGHAPGGAGRQRAAQAARAAS